jgi:ferredoxin
MKAIVDKDTCIGCGLCPSVCPEIYQMEDDGKAVASEEEVPEDLKDSAREGAEQCPVDAIAIEE